MVSNEFIQALREAQREFNESCDRLLAKADQLEKEFQEEIKQIKEQTDATKRKS